MTLSSNPIVFPAKVSGFYQGVRPSLLDTEKLKQELSRLHGLSGSPTWDFLDLSEYPDYSYHLCSIMQDGCAYFFFMNKYAPIAAFSRVQNSKELDQWSFPDPMPQNAYIDWSDGIRLLEGFWTIVPVEILTLSVDADNLKSQSVVVELQNEEFAQFSYWEPQNMGNILFNNWEKRGYY